MTQRILVTAGASGIGREIARAFAAGGGAVCICDIDGAALELAAKDIPGLRTAVCDVSKRDDVEQMVARAAASLGGIDVLVNNAGIPGPTEPVEEPPGAVGGARIERVFEGRAKATNQSLEEVRKEAMSAQSIKRLVDPKDIAALAILPMRLPGRAASGSGLKHAEGEACPARS